MSIHDLAETTKAIVSHVPAVAVVEDVHVLVADATKIAMAVIEAVEGTVIGTKQRYPKVQIAAQDLVDEMTATVTTTIVTAKARAVAVVVDAVATENDHAKIAIVTKLQQAQKTGLVKVDVADATGIAKPAETIVPMRVRSVHVKAEFRPGKKPLAV